ncbi:MAG: MAPEG family protein [Proteobacteria bacterium]|nr:MAPEG family protein [Pseudomonadota bacterium]
MTIADWCILGAVLIFLLTLAPMKVIGGRTFDNYAPRDPAFWSTPLRSRVQGAHINGIETFPFFAAAILLAEMKHGAQPVVDGLAVGFLVVRLAFVGAYIANRAWTRTVIWNVGFLLNLLIFLSPILWRA